MNLPIVTYNTALTAKKKGFPQKDGFMYLSSTDGKEHALILREANNQGEHVCAAPTQALLKMWLREKHTIFVYVNQEWIGSDEWDWSYKIDWLPTEKENVKRRCGEFVSKESYKEYGSTYTGAWSKYESALESALTEALNLLPDAE